MVNQEAQKIHFPKFISTLTNLGVHNEWETKGTSIFSLGALSKLRPWGKTPQLFAGNYKYTFKELRYLIRQHKLPPFTVCMIQDLDLRIHFKGPMDIRGVAKVDREIQKTLNLFPSWEEAIKLLTWIVIGDNGHSPTGISYRKFIINLPRILKKYRIAKINRPVQLNDQLVLAVNQRTAYVYIEDPTIPTTQIVHELQNDKRIDLIVWREGDTIHVKSGMKDGKLTFSKGRQYTDQYKQSWNIQGNEHLLDISIRNNYELQYGDFPDALARLYGALMAQDERVVVLNAKPGCDFKGESTPFHVFGAAHGSLHKQESHVPLIICGTTMEPDYFRIVDLKKYLLSLLIPSKA